MDCLLKKCYFCLEQTDNLTNIDNSSSMKTKLVQGLIYFGFNVFWLNRSVLICEKCSWRLREAFEFVSMCHKNNNIVQGYLNLSDNEQQIIEDEEQLALHFDDSADATCNIKLENPEDDESAEYKEIVKYSENVPINEAVLAPSETQSQIKSEIKIEHEFEEILIQEYHSEAGIKGEFLFDPEESEEECYTKNSTDTPVSVEISANDCERTCNNIATSSSDDKRNIENQRKRNVSKSIKKSYICSICKRGYATKSALNYHIKHHNGDRLYECSMCPKTFMHKGHLTQHILTHTEESRYKCSTCNKGFHRKSCLYRHVRIHNDDKQFQCSFCSKRFIHNSHLTSHLRIHTGDKPYKCSICNKCYHTNTSLKYHVLLHTGEKPYKCETCNKCFCNKSNLTAHVRIHTGEKPFKCAICSKAFTQKASVKEHMRMHL